MSMSGAVYFTSNSDNQDISIDLFLSVLRKKFWSPIFMDSICYLPLGDENFDWTTASGSDFLCIKEVLIKKYENREIIGLLLYWKNTAIGVNALIYPKFERITFSLDANRVEIEGTDVTDYTWYLERLLPIAFDLNISLESIQCIDG